MLNKDKADRVYDEIMEALYMASKVETLLGTREAALVVGQMAKMQGSAYQRRAVIARYS